MPKEILVLECIVAGTSFRKLNEVEAALQSEVKLEVKREAKNELYLVKLKWVMFPVIKTK